MEHLENWIDLGDIHSPEYDRRTWHAILSYLKVNKVDGVILSGDQLDLACISHWNKNNHLVKLKGGLKRDLDNFDRDILTPLESLLPKCQKVWIDGNHERFITDRVQEDPELFGMLDHVRYLQLKERGWKIIPLGGSFKLGKLNVIHGETISGAANAARKAVEIYSSNVLLHHFHSPSSYSKTSPVNHKHKFMAWVAPIIGKVNPIWIKNRANSWINGFTIIEVRRPSGLFNLYPVVILDGVFSYGGKVYR